MVDNPLSESADLSMVWYLPSHLGMQAIIISKTKKIKVKPLEESVPWFGLLI